MGAPKTSSSKRWRPTGEQVMILKGLFKGGLTTPSAHQIQKITTQLMEYGKVESKNVFYWFQNHKAREKQKLAKKLLYHNNNINNNNNNNNNNNLMYYFYLPTQYPSGVYPLLPPQAMRDSLQWRSLEKQAEAKDDGSSSVDVTWLTTEYDSNHHQHQHHEHQKNHQGSLKTLELFPTTPTSSSSYSSSICIAN